MASAIELVQIQPTAPSVAHTILQNGERRRMLEEERVAKRISLIGRPEDHCIGGLVMNRRAVYGVISLLASFLLMYGTYWSLTSVRSESYPAYVNRQEVIRKGLELSIEAVRLSEQQLTRAKAGLPPDPAIDRRLKQIEQELAEVEKLDAELRRRELSPIPFDLLPSNLVLPATLAIGALLSLIFALSFLKETFSGKVKKSVSARGCPAIRQSNTVMFMSWGASGNRGCFIPTFQRADGAKIDPFRHGTLIGRLHLRHWKTAQTRQFRDSPARHDA